MFLWRQHNAGQDQQPSKILTQFKYLVTTSTDQNRKHGEVKSMRSALFWDVTQRREVIQYRRFETTCRSLLQGPRNARIPSSRVRKSRKKDLLTLEDGTDRLYRNVVMELGIKIPRTVILCFGVGVKLDLSHEEKNIGWGCSRVGCWVRYFGQRDEVTAEWRKLHIRIFVVFTLH